GELVISERAGFQRDTLETIEFKIQRNERLYGGGARALGMDRRGYRLELYNRAHYGYETYSELMNYTMPIVLSSNQYMLHFDNAPIGFLDLDSEGKNTISYETISGRKTYQVVVGDSWLDLVDNYTDLTGKQPMLPRWALGNFSSRFGYHSQEEVLETINVFKEEEIPVDAIIIDLYWFGKEIQGTLGNFEFYADSFPNPQQMVDELRIQDIETILITEPFVLKTSNRWEEAVEKNVLAKDSTGEAATFEFYFGNGGIIDVYSEDGYNWFSDIYSGLMEIGVTGMWGDLGEPEMHPSYVIHETGTADEVHNIYGHDWARLVYNTFREYDPEIRPFILMRAGYSGSQRYGLVPWTGDVARSWGGLNRQVEISLQMGMQGIGYMHSDLGGFAGANLDDELYARWMQYGVFQPIYRPHAQEDVPSEPVFRSEIPKELSKEAIELRYAMLPYNYSLTFENSTSGAPLMRPLFFEEPDNEVLYDYDGTYLWGNDFLVSPVLYSEVESQEVYFPESSNWFDFYTGEEYEGGSTAEIEVVEEYIPTFVRAGSIIPFAKPLQTTKQYDGNTLEIHYYYHSEVERSDYMLYNDDGVTFAAYEKGEYELIEISTELKENEILIHFAPEIGEEFMASNKSINLVIHNLETQPAHIEIEGNSVDGVWDENAKKSIIPFTWNTEEPLNIGVALIP
ncbi:MAG: DUF5110 domain-containing protein, partial [Balneolales bacterium]|nr:DUF5110 domain-containing protein [Balneolales bacterium]